MYPVQLATAGSDHQTSSVSSITAASCVPRLGVGIRDSMAEHEPCIGATDDWYTPPEIFDALGLTFDLDPCSPGAGHWVPARQIYTEADDGLRQPWHGVNVSETKGS